MHAAGLIGCHISVTQLSFLVCNIQFVAVSMMQSCQPLLELAMIVLVAFGNVQSFQFKVCGVSLTFALCRLWDEFISDLSKSVDCSADAAVEGKAGKVVIPGGKLLGKFQPSKATDLHNANHFGELGMNLLHAEPQKSYGIGTCNLMVSAHTLKTPIRPEAEQEILFKLKCGFRQGLWPVLHLDDPVGHLEMPSRAAENASQKQLLEGLQTALSAVNSGRGLSLLQGMLSLASSRTKTYSSRLQTKGLHHHTFGDIKPTEVD